MLIQPRMAPDYGCAKETETVAGCIALPAPGCALCLLGCAVPGNHGYCRKLIAGWVAAGMQRSKADDRLDTVPRVAMAIPAGWSIHVDSKGVTLSFPKLKEKPKFRRPLLLRPW